MNLKTFLPEIDFDCVLQLERCVFSWGDEMHGFHTRDLVPHLDLGEHGAHAQVVCLPSMKTRCMPSTRDLVMYFVL